MKIITLTKEDESLVQQAAQLLMDAFREHWPEAWPTMKEAQQEILEMLEQSASVAVIDDQRKLLGIIGGIPQYDGHVWELHPLAIQPEMQVGELAKCWPKILRNRCASRAD
ncbi:GNAT family N-acetyltransferase [Candidatus Villigracilis proximus]|uniref:GNAT family N-acetyltransferase n=1 Tax=Candidatus Villigracilis proximus TaxID=3140683 RepID=UPI0031F10A31